MEHRIKNQIFWYKAELHNDFKVGNDTFWKHDNQEMSQDEGTQTNSTN